MNHKINLELKKLKINQKINLQLKNKHVDPYDPYGSTIRMTHTDC